MISFLIMKKEYVVLKEKYGLPDFDDVDRDFEIYSISKDDDLIREILKKMFGVVDFYINFLEDIIQPDSRFYTLKEANVLGKSERALVNATYNKLLYLHRKNVELSLDYEEKKAAKFIVQVFEEWQIVRRDLLPVVSLLKESWSKKVEEKHDGGYFG